MFDDRPSNSNFTKMLIRLKLKFLIMNKVFTYRRQMTRSIVEFRPDKILIISPEVFNLESLNTIKVQVPQVKFILYMWDSFYNKPNAKKLLSKVSKCYSFDRADSLNHKNIKHEPLFFESVFKSIEDKPRTNKLLFVGTFHKSRSLLLHYIDKYEKNFIHHVYIQSTLVKVFRVLSLFPSLSYMKMLSKYSKTVSVEKEKIAQLLFQTQVVIDFHHRNQTGLTCRTFETLASGCKLATTNKDIMNYDFYDSKFIKVISDREYEDLDFFINTKISSEKKASFLKKMQEYSLSNWVKRIIEED